MDPLVLLVSLSGAVMAALASAVGVMWRSRSVLEGWVLEQLKLRDQRIERLEQENYRLASGQLRDVIAALNAASTAMDALSVAIKQGPCPRLQAGVESDVFHSPDPMSATLSSHSKPRSR